DVRAAIREACPRGLLHAVDTSGLPAAVSQVLSALAHRGSLAMVTATPREAVLEVPMLAAIYRGITLRGVIEGDAHPDTFIPRLVDLVIEGRFPLAKLVRHYDLSQINEALEDQERGRVIKPIIRMPGD